MTEGIMLRNAAEADAEGIAHVLSSNQDDISLFQQPLGQVCKTLGDFVIATKGNGEVVGCAALHWHTPEVAEVLAVAVMTQAQGRGVGGRLMRECICRSQERNAKVLWLGTAKPGYFERFGFRPFSRWELPLSVLLNKLQLVFQQPPSRWLPAIFGRHRFMVWRGAEK